MESAKKRGWTKKSALFLTENHHVIPKSMGGENLDHNLVRLTPREHYIAHMLLYRIYETREMAYALVCLSRMSRTGVERCTARGVERARILAAELSRQRMIDNNPSKKGRDGPKFKGLYHTPCGVFESCKDAAVMNGLGDSTIHRRCMNPDKVITARKLGKENIGKSFRDIGYWFEGV